MNCGESVTLLSDFHDGHLSEPDCVSVMAHLIICLPCRGVFQDLKLIVTTASRLGNDEQITFPNEAVIWQQLDIGVVEIH